MADTDHLRVFVDGKEYVIDEGIRSWMLEQKEVSVIEYIDEDKIAWALDHIDWKYENVNWSI